MTQNSTFFSQVKLLTVSQIIYICTTLTMTWMTNDNISAQHKSSPICSLLPLSFVNKSTLYSPDYIQDIHHLLSFSYGSSQGGGSSFFEIIRIQIRHVDCRINTNYIDNSAFQKCIIKCILFLCVCRIMKIVHKYRVPLLHLIKSVEFQNFHFMSLSLFQ